jgi:hypothetical protein
MAEIDKHEQDCVDAFNNKIVVNDEDWFRLLIEVKSLAQALNLIEKLNKADESLKNFKF